MTRDQLNDKKELLKKDVEYYQEHLVIAKAKLELLDEILNEQPAVATDGELEQQY